MPVRVKTPPRKPRRADKLQRVTTNEFLQSYAWRKLRYVVLLRDGKRCVCCGVTPETGGVMNVDHIKPRKTHPELALDENVAANIYVWKLTNGDL